ncbi:MAG TPA: VWA domain-containing protein [Vicinamibacterales bacterium]|nr:VWA domain-containing protein [Vicinamibacterales bacterium]
MGKRVALVVLLAAAGGLVLSAQSQPPQAPVFRSGVDLVRFDLSVVDQTGRPITDLKPDEIRIVEDGRALPILLFQHVDEPAGTYRDEAIRAVSAEVTSNQGMPRGHLYVLVFDQHHIAPGNEQIARRAAQEFIERRVRPTDRVAVVGLPGPGPQLGFTADRSRAVAELEKVHGDLQRNLDTPVGRLSIEEAFEIAGGNATVLQDVIDRQAADLGSDVSAGASVLASGRADRGAEVGAGEQATARKVMTENARAVVQQVDTTSREFLQRFADVIKQYSAIEGRKTVVLFSEGFHDQNLSRDLQDVAAAAAQSYSVIWSMDLNRRTPDVKQGLTPSTTPSTEVQNRLASLGTLAVETDGVLVNDAAAHLDKALAQLADRSQDYYLVGFTPSADAAAAPGSYRRVQVQVTRPGAVVSARTGYTVPRADAKLDRRRAIDAALAAPFVQQALKIDYTTYVLRSEASGQPRVVLSLEADLPVRDQNHTTADVVFVARDVRDGRVAASGTDTIPLPEQPLKDGVMGRSAYRVQFEVPPGSYLMRAVVREPGGLVGSADRRLDVRSVSGPAVSVSDLVLGSVTGALPVRAEAFTDDGLGGIVEAYGRSDSQLADLSARASLVPLGGDHPTQTVQAVLDEPVTSGASVVRRATFELPLNGVPPGKYIARVHVQDGAEPVADLSREVDVRAGSAPPAASAAAAPAFRPADLLDGDIVRTARAAWQKSGTPAAAHALKGLDLFAQEQYAPAAAELKESMTLDHSSAAAAFVLGWAWEQAGDHRQAIGAWRAAANIDPMLVPAHLALADAYLRMSEPALAVQALRAGLSAMPGSPELQSKLAQIEKR